MSIKRVAITGTIQGANRALAIDNQDYRTELARILTEQIPGVECFDPSRPVIDLVGDPEVLAELAPLITAPSPAIEMGALGPAYRELRTAFLDMTKAVGECDLCIAYLPGTVSMGTAMEMYAAHLAGVPVVAITDLVDNLAIASVSGWIVRDLDAFEAWLVRYAVTGS